MPGSRAVIVRGGENRQARLRRRLRRSSTLTGPARSPGVRSYREPAEIPGRVGGGLDAEVPVLPPKMTPCERWACGEHMSGSVEPTAGGSPLAHDVLGAGHPFVLIHADSMDRRFWDFQLDAFSSRFRVVRYDLR